MSNSPNDIRVMKSISWVEYVARMENTRIIHNLAKLFKENYPLGDLTQMGW
jgi:hypothetical protein